MSDEFWDGPVEAKALIARLRAQVATLKARIAELERRKPAESKFPTASGFPDP